MKRVPIQLDELYRIYRESKAVKTPRDFQNDDIEDGDLYVAWRTRSGKPGRIMRRTENLWCFLEHRAPFLLKPVLPFVRRHRSVSCFMLDWNASAQAALKRGAHYAVIDDARAQKKGTNCILVESSRATLKALAARHRRHLSSRIIAITGSCGKTTTKGLVNAVLGTRYRAECSQGTFNTALYAQKTLLNLDENTELGIIEMGADGPGQLKECCEVVQPSFGLITCIGKAHLEGFDSIEGVLKAKGELFDYLVSTGGHVFKNVNDARLARLVNNYDKVTTYGSTEDAEVYGIVVGNSPHLTVRWYPSRESRSEYYDLATRLFGEYNLHNVLAAISAGLHFDVPIASINEAIQEYETVKLRSEIVSRGSNHIILDAYNANPTSMKAALAHFHKMEAARKVAVIGDMLELGRASPEEHRAIIAYAEELAFDQTVFVGKEFMKARRDDFGLYFTGVKAARRWFGRQDWVDTHILLKASRGIAIERLMGGLQDSCAE